jgi:hypothetical protein
MIRHQTVRMHRAPEAGREFRKEPQVGRVVALQEEALLTVNATLHDMNGQTRQHSTSDSWHASPTRLRIETLTV